MKICDRQVQILDKETRDIVLFKGIYVSIVIREHLVGDSFNGRICILNFILNVSSVKVLGLLHFALAVVALAKVVIYH